MPQFQFLARDTAGRLQQGELQAATARAAIADLGGRGLRILKLDDKTSGSQQWVARLQKLRPREWIRPGSADVVLCFSQLAVMLRSGLTILTALKTVAEHASKPSLERVCREIAEQIEDGASFAEAMQGYRCFPKIAVQLVRVGEQTGTLENVLERAAQQIERRRQTTVRLVSALSYPLLVTIAAIGVSAYMVAVVIPQLGVFLRSIGRRLPALTQYLLDFANFTQQYGLTILAICAALPIALIATYFWPPGRMWIDRWVLRMPVTGSILRTAGTATFASSMAILIRSGITVIDALRAAERLHGNRFLASIVANARDQIIQGETLARPLAVPFAYAPMLSRMVAVAENTGTLDELLEEVGDFHEKQLDAKIRWLSTIIEPAMILVVGGLVAFVYIAFFLALFAAGGVQ